MTTVSLSSLLTNRGTDDRYVINSSRELELIPASQLAIEHDPFSGDVLGLLTEPASTNHFPDSENLTTGVDITGNISVSTKSIAGRPASATFGSNKETKTIGTTFGTPIAMDRVAVTFFVRHGDLSTPQVGTSYDDKASLHILVNGVDIFPSISEIEVRGPLSDNSYRVRANLRVASGSLTSLHIAVSTINNIKLMDVGGIQVEKDVWTSYMPTTGSPVSRGSTSYEFELTTGQYFNQDQGTFDVAYTPFPNSTGAAMTIGDRTGWSTDHISVGVQPGYIDKFAYGASFKTTNGLRWHYQHDAGAGEKNATVRLCYSGYGVRFCVNSETITPLKDFRSFKQVPLTGKIALGEAPDGSIMSGYITLFNYYARTFTDAELQAEVTTFNESEDLINVTAAAVFRTDVEATMYMNVVEPPTPERILAAWPRATNGDYFSDPSQATGGNIQEWYFDSQQYSFVMPINSNSMEQIFSPIRLSSYVFEATLTAPGSDDDYLALIAAADVINGELCTVMVGVHTGGVNGIPTFSIRYFDDSTGRAWAGGQTIAGNNLIEANTTPNGDPAKGWNGKKIKVQVIRNGNVISGKITDWDSGVYMSNSEIFCNLDSLPGNGSQLAEAGRYGFASNSIAESTFLDYNLQSTNVINEQKIYSSETNSYWRFVDGVWTLQGTPAQDDLLPATSAINSKTKETFVVDSGNVAFDSSNGISENEATLNLPADATTDMPYSDVIDQFTFVDPLFFGGTFNDSNLISEQVDGQLRVVTNATDGYFYVLVKTDETVDEFGITEETIAFRKVNVQVS